MPKFRGVSAEGVVKGVVEACGNGCGTGEKRERCSEDGGVLRSAKFLRTAEVEFWYNGWQKELMQHADGVG